MKIAQKCSNDIERQKIIKMSFLFEKKSLLIRVNEKKRGPVARVSLIGLRVEAKTASKSNRRFETQWHNCNLDNHRSLRQKKRRGDNVHLRTTISVWRPRTFPGDTKATAGDATHSNAILCCWPKAWGRGALPFMRNLRVGKWRRHHSKPH